MIYHAIIILGGIAVLLAAEGVYFLVRYAGERERTELRRRLRTLEEGFETTQTGPSLFKERRLASSPSLARLVENMPMVGQIEDLLLKTDLGWTVFSLIIMSGGLGMTASVAVYLLAKDLWISFVFFLLGAAVPTLVALKAQTHRAAKISKQLPEALDMIVRSLQAGHGITTGFKLVASEMPPPVSVEFARAYEEQNLGVPLHVAVENITRRVDKNLDLRIFAVCVTIQHQTGGNLVELLYQLATTLREREKFQGKVRSLTAEGRVSGIVLGALPFVTGVLITFVNPAYLAPLVTDPVGRMLLLGGCVSWIGGVLWLRNLSRVEM